MFFSRFHACMCILLCKCVCFLQGTLCDVTLVVQGRHFSAHRVVLAAASHFFNLMFTSKCAHTNTSSWAEILTVTVREFFQTQTYAHK